MKNIPLSFLVLLTYASLVTYLGIKIHSLFFLMYMVLFIMTMIDLMTMKSNGNILSTRTIVFLLTGRIKRVKTSFGRFFITSRESSSNSTIIELYQDKFFYMKEIGSHNYQDTDSMKAWIKSIYDKKYQEKEALRSKYREIKKWNGYIDIQHERDSKINQVIK